MACINALTFHGNSSIESLCRTIRQTGFTEMEVSRPPFYDQLQSPITRRRFARWVADLGLELRGFDCWVEVEPYAQFAHTLEEFRRAVDWAAELSLGYIITHDPWSRVNGQRSPAACLQPCIELFCQVAERCAAAGLGLVFEPHPDTLSMDNAWAVRFIDAVAQAGAAGRVGLVYDCCHYGVGQPATYVQAIAALGHRIHHLHFSDGDQQTYALHLPLGDGVLDLQGVIAALGAVGFVGTLTSDLYSYPLPEDGACRNLAPMQRVAGQLGLSGGRR